MYPLDDDIKKENTLDDVKVAPLAVLGERIKEFLSIAEDVTARRRNTFNALMPFALEDDQWTDTEEKSREGEAVLTFNHSIEYVERYMAKLFPRNSHTGLMEVGVKITELNKELSSKYEKEILNCYKENDIIAFLLEQGLNYLVGGAGCCYYPKNNYGGADIVSLDPRYVYLGWQSGKLVQFAFKEFFGTKYKIHYWDSVQYVVIGLEGRPESRLINTNGFIPFTWIPNFPRPHRHEGRSKVLSILDLDREYNFRASDFSKRTSDNTEPMLAVMSNDVKEGTIKRGKKKVLYLAQGDKAEYLKVDEGKDLLEWLEKIETKINKKTGLLNNQSVQKGISGVSLSYQYSDMLDMIGFMRVYWDRMFRELNNAILTYKFGINNYKTDPVYQPALIQDSKARVEEVAIMIDKKIISHKDAIDELRGCENAEEKVAEIIAEDEKFNPIHDQNVNVKRII